MPKKMGIPLRVIFALIALVFCYGLLNPTGLSVLYLVASKLNWTYLGLRFIYLATAVWALWTYRRSQRILQRLLLGSIVAAALLLFATDLLALLRPNLASFLRHPIGTVIGYTTAALVIAAMIIDTARVRTS